MSSDAPDAASRDQTAWGIAAASTATRRAPTDRQSSVQRAGRSP